jgi:hypothetical protein
VLFTNLFVLNIDTSLFEMANLRALERPSPDHLKRLQHELSKLTARSILSSGLTECWDSAHDDDFTALHSGIDKGSRVNIWIKLGLEILKWELWGRKKVRYKSGLLFKPWPDTCDHLTHKPTGPHINDPT